MNSLLERGSILFGGDADRLAAGKLDQLRRGKTEHRPIAAGGGPYFLVGKQRFINERFDGIQVPDRRHAPHRKTGLRKHIIRRGHLYIFSSRLRQGCDVGPVCSADFHQVSLTGFPPTKHKRLHNAIQAATQRARRIPGRSRAVRDANHLQSETGPLQRGLHSADGFVRRRIYQRSSFCGRVTE